MLFYEIAEIIKIKRPKILLLENVKGLLNHDNGQTFGTILSTLDELGYDAEWELLNSKDFGVPQNRERVYIIGYLRGECELEVFPIRRHCKNVNEESRGEQHIPSQISGTVISGYAKHPGDGTYIKVVNNPKHSNNRVYDPEGLSPTLRTGVGGNQEPFILVPEATQKGYTEAKIGDAINLTAINSTTRRGRVGRQIAHTLDTGCEQGTYDGTRIRKLTPTECERLQGFPDGWTEGVSNTQRYKQLGNAVTTNVVKYIIQQINRQLDDGN
jgi:DNA (cytosine-5)-methyltransferase 1